MLSDGVQFPTSETGDGFGVGEQTFALAQFVFRELLFGDVLRSAEDADGPASMVGDANGARLKNANATVGKHETDFIFERLLIAKQGLYFLPDAHAVVGVKQGAGASDRNRLLVRRQAQHAVHLSRTR